MVYEALLVPWSFHPSVDHGLIPCRCCLVSCSPYLHVRPQLSGCQLWTSSLIQTFFRCEVLPLPWGGLSVLLLKKCWRFQVGYEKLRSHMGRKILQSLFLQAGVTHKLSNFPNLPYSSLWQIRGRLTSAVQAQLNGTLMTTIELLTGHSTTSFCKVIIKPIFLLRAWYLAENKLNPFWWMNEWASECTGDASTNLASVFQVQW